MLKQLFDKRTKLMYRRQIIDKVCGVSAIASILCMGVVIGTAINVEANFKAFQVSSTLLAVSTTALLVSNKANDDNDRSLIITEDDILSALDTPPTILVDSNPIEL